MTWIFRVSPSKIRRIITVIVFFVLFTAAAFAGVLTPLSSQEAQSRNNDLEHLQVSIKEMSVLQRTFEIFQNNFFLDLIMFIPVVGPVFGLYVSYNTGVYIGAQSTVYHVSPVAVMFVLLILPFALLEFIAYSTAMGESVWLVWRVVQGKVTREVRNFAIVILICAGILLLAAFIEAIMIG